MSTRNPYAAKRDKQAISEQWARAAMKWWKSLTPASKRHMKQFSHLESTHSICRYWLNAIATPQEADNALRRDHVNTNE